MFIKCTHEKNGPAHGLAFATWETSRHCIQASRTPSVSQEWPGRLTYPAGGLDPRHCAHVSGKTDLSVTLFFPSDLQDDFISPCGACRQVMREVSSSFFLECKSDAFPLAPSRGRETKLPATVLFAALAGFKGLPEPTRITGYNSFIYVKTRPGPALTVYSAGDKQ